MMGASSGAMPDARRHVPVMLADVLDALQPKAHETYIDGTFGAGGYTRAILQAADCRVVAFDRDPTAIAAGGELVATFEPRLILVHRPFGSMAEAIVEAGVPQADGVVLDIGVSSMQIDEAERGFSFQSDGPLDMRMSCDGPSAADVLNSFSEEQIADIIYEYGEERRSRAIARAVVKARTEAPLLRTKELADLVLRVFHGRKEDGRHPATRTFQALRIFVNDELGELERGLRAAEKILKPGGRLVVVTFHSLEDRIVKQFLAERSGKVDRGSRYLPQKNIQFLPASFRIVNSRPLTPQKGELDLNPRARSARLRAAIRTDAPAWGGSAPAS
jgi:16S rRNA (cytosine1402-N4)-methyltransferase